MTLSVNGMFSKDVETVVGSADSVDVMDGPLRVCAGTAVHKKGFSELAPEAKDADDFCCIANRDLASTTRNRTAPLDLQTAHRLH